MSSERCGWCQTSPVRLVKSHVIPEAIVTEGLEAGQCLAVASVEQPAARSWTGIYSRIVCASCEQRFKVDDDYLIDVHRRLHEARYAFDGQGIELHHADGGRLARCFLSMLFRAHLSTHEVFQGVDLGVHGGPLADFLASTHTNAPREFSVVLRFNGGPIGEAWFCPFSEKWQGVNAYRFYIPKLTAVIRVDRRPLPHPWPALALRQGAVPLAMYSDRFSRSEEVLTRRIADARGGQLARIFERRARKP